MGSISLHRFIVVASMGMFGILPGAQAQDASIYDVSQDPYYSDAGNVSTSRQGLFVSLGFPDGIGAGFRYDGGANSPFGFSGGVHYFSLDLASILSSSITDNYGTDFDEISEIDDADLTLETSKLTLSADATYSLGSVFLYGGVRMTSFDTDLTYDVEALDQSYTGSIALNISPKWNVQPSIGIGGLSGGTQSRLRFGFTLGVTYTGGFEALTESNFSCSSAFCNTANAEEFFNTTELEDFNEYLDGWKIIPELTSFIQIGF